MEGKAFQRRLLDAAVLAMGCDGDVDAREVAAIRELAESAPYFEGIETDKEIDLILSDFQEKGTQAIEDFLDAAKELSLSEKEERRMYEVLLQVVEADGEVRPEEKSFLAGVQDALGTEETLFVMHFPTHLSTLSALSTGAEREFTALTNLPNLPNSDSPAFDDDDLTVPASD